MKCDGCGVDTIKPKTKLCTACAQATEEMGIEREQAMKFIRADVQRQIAWEKSKEYEIVRKYREAKR